MNDQNPVAGIKLDPQSLAVIVQKAVIDSITPEAKEKLVIDAVKALLTVPKDDRPSYQRQQPLQSPLELAFNGAVQSAARDIVFKAVNDDEAVQEAIKAIVHPLVFDLCEGNYDGLPEALGNAFAEWLKHRR